MTWEVRLGSPTDPLWLQLVDGDRATFGPHPRKYRSRSFAEAALKKARPIIVGQPLTLVETP